MNRMQMKNLGGKIHMPHIHMPHMPDAHQMGIKFNHVVHDSRFWAVVALVVIATLIVLTALLSSSGSTPVTPMPGPTYPFPF